VHWAGWAELYVQSLNPRALVFIRLDIARDDSLADCHAVDLTNAEATRELVNNLGPFDSLVNLAGGFAMGIESWDASDEQWDLMFSLNVSTMRNAIRAAVPVLLEQQAGSIVNVGAFGAREGQGLMGAYCASKSVVMRLTETLAEELKTRGVNVNAVLPTVIDTPANRAAMPDSDPAELTALQCPTATLPIGCHQTTWPALSASCFLRLPKPCTVRCCLCVD